MREHKNTPRRQSCNSGHGTASDHAAPGAAGPAQKRCHQPLTSSKGVYLAQWKKRHKLSGSQLADSHQRKRVNVIRTMILNRLSSRHSHKHYSGICRAVLAYALLLALLLPAVAAQGCDPVKIGDLEVVDNPVCAAKVARTKLTTLRILEETYLGSLTCHVLTDSGDPVFEHFFANTSTVFRSANAYEPFRYGQKTHRYIACDIFLIDSDFRDSVVDLSIVLLLRPLIDDAAQHNQCASPVIKKKTVRIDFRNYRGTPCYGRDYSQRGGSAAHTERPGAELSTRYERPPWFKKDTTTSPRPTTTTTQRPFRRRKPKPSRRPTRRKTTKKPRRRPSTPKRPRDPDPPVSTRRPRRKPPSNSAKDDSKTSSSKEVENQVPAPPDLEPSEGDASSSNRNQDSDTDGLRGIHDKGTHGVSGESEREKEEEEQTEKVTTNKRAEESGKENNRGENEIEVEIPTDKTTTSQTKPKDESNADENGIPGSSSAGNERGTGDGKLGQNGIKADSPSESSTRPALDRTTLPLATSTQLSQGTPNDDVENEVVDDEPTDESASEVNSNRDKANRAEDTSTGENPGSNTETGASNKDGSSSSTEQAPHLVTNFVNPDTPSVQRGTTTLKPSTSLGDNNQGKPATTSTKSTLNTRNEATSTVKTNTQERPTENLNTQGTSKSEQRPTTSTAKLTTEAIATKKPTTSTTPTTTTSTTTSTTTTSTTTSTTTTSTTSTTTTSTTTSTTTTSTTTSTTTTSTTTTSTTSTTTTTSTTSTTTTTSTTPTTTTTSTTSTTTTTSTTPKTTTRTSSPTTTTSATTSERVVTKVLSRPSPDQTSTPGSASASEGSEPRASTQSKGESRPRPPARTQPESSRTTRKPKVTTTRSSRPRITIPEAVETLPRVATTRFVEETSPRSPDRPLPAPRPTPGEPETDDSTTAVNEFTRRHERNDGIEDNDGNKRGDNDPTEGSEGFGNRDTTTAPHLLPERPRVGQPTKGPTDRKLPEIPSQLYEETTSSTVAKNETSVSVKPLITTTEPVITAGGGIGQNASLFWSVLAFLLCLILVIVGVLIYYCCPSMCSCCGECLQRDKELRLLQASKLGSSSGRAATATDLRLVSVRDVDGRPIHDATTVDILSKNKNAIKSYPVLGNMGSRPRTSPSRFGNRRRGSDHIELLPEHLDFDPRRRRRHGGHLDPMEQPRAGSALSRYFRDRFSRNSNHQGSQTDRMYGSAGEHRQRSRSAEGPQRPPRRTDEWGNSAELHEVSDDPQHGDLLVVEDRPREALQRNTRIRVKVKVISSLSRSSPVVFRILRAVTPRFFQSADSSSRPGYVRQNSRGSRAFHVVKDEFERRRSGRSRSDVQVLTLDDPNRIAGPDVQVLSLDHNGDATEMFRREGSAEILQLDTDDTSLSADSPSNDPEADQDHMRINLEDNSHLRIPITDEGGLPPRRSPSGLEVVPEAEEERLNTTSRSTADGATSPAVPMEDRLVQTDFTFAKTNKKSQTMSTALRLSDSDSDSDNDLANQSLSQSLIAQQLHTMQLQHAFNKSFNDPGFLNVAMNTLVTDEIKQNGHRNLPRDPRLPSDAKLLQLMHAQQAQQQWEEESELERSHRSLLSYPGRSYSRHTHKDSFQGSEAVANDDQPGNRRFSVRKKASNYYDGSRSPGSPTYTETKASMLRKRSMINKRNETTRLAQQQQQQQQQIARKRSNPLLSKRYSSSLSDLNRLREEQPASIRRQISSPVSLNGWR